MKFSPRDDKLIHKLKDHDYRHAFAEASLGSYIALQIRANRDRRGWSQQELADRAGMNQSQVSRLENEEYGSWTVKSLLKIARAFDLALGVYLEDFPEMLARDEDISFESLSRHGFSTSLAQSHRDWKEVQEIQDSASSKTVISEIGEDGSDDHGDAANRS